MIRNLLFAESHSIALMLMAAGLGSHECCQSAWQASDIIVLTSSQTVPELLLRAGERHGLRVISAPEFYLSEIYKCETLYLHSFCPYAGFKDYIEAIEYGNLIVYADGVKGVLDPINITANMRADAYLFFGWVDLTRLPAHSEAKVRVCPFSSIVTLFRSISVLLPASILSSTGMDALQSSDLIVFQRYFTRGVYTFRSNSELDRFIDLLANQLADWSGSSSVFFYPDYRCSGDFNLRCQEIFSGHFSSVRTSPGLVNGSDHTAAIPAETILLRLNPQSLPRHAYGFDSGVGLVLKSLGMNFFEYLEPDREILSCLDTVGALTFEHYMRMYKVVSTLLDGHPGFGETCITKEGDAYAIRPFEAFIL
jgi:hypothetical protein